MGQNQTHLQSTPRGRQPSQQQTPPPRPASPPQIPKIPNYAVPENRVLHVDAGGLANKRQLLRPVSQELSKFHPEFADIFQCETGNHLTKDDLGFKSDEKENVISRDGGTLSMSPVQNGDFDSRFSHTLPNGTSKTKDLSVKPNNTELSRSQSMQEKPANGRVVNGVVPHGQVSVNPNGRDEERGRSETRSSGVTRTNSLDRSTASSTKAHVHKRYPSATTSLANEDSVIPEDPREHLYTHWRQDPYSNPPPQVTSLPVKNTFDVDYSFNLTYAQLAEFRRQKRISDLEDRTGKKLTELNAELSQKSSLPANPFDRNNYQPSQPSGSSGASSETGVSKSKKRRAPPPPSANGRRDSSPGRLSLDVEPPADYDLDDPSPRGEHTTPWKPSLTRKDSTASKTSTNSKGFAPKPPAPPAPAPPVASAASSSNVPTSRTQSLPRGATAKPAATSPSSGTLPSKGSAAAVSAASARLIAQAKAELEALKKLKALLEEKDAQSKGESSDEKTKGNAADEKAKDSAENGKSQGEGESNNVSESAATSGVSEAGNTEKRKQEDEPHKSEGDDLSSPSDLCSSSSVSMDSETQESNSKPTEPEKSNATPRLSSLLQHDIVLAAQARGMKGQLKAKSPVQHKRPKDAHEMFREELAKAATAREERRKSVDPQDGQASADSPAGDEDSNEAVVFKSDLVKVQRKSALNEVSLTAATSDPGSSPNKAPKEAPAVAAKPSLNAVTSNASLNGVTSYLSHNVVTSNASLKEPSSPSEAPPPPPMQAKTGVSRSESDLLSAQKTSNRISASAAARQRIPDDEQGPGNNALRRAASEDGVLELSDDDVGELFPADTIPVTSRAFPEDWKPEDDLDSDDDMRDDLTFSRQSAALEASDGFKSSIIPSKVDDLKSAKRKSKSGRNESTSSTDERSKYGSIRKFRKSVHESVRHAFGSISKASGKLLRRGKSHDFNMDDVQGRHYRVSSEEDPRFSSSNGLDNDDDRDPRFIHLADAASGAGGSMPKGVKPEGYMMVNGHISDDDTDDEAYYDAEEPVTPDARAEKQVRMMKRAGVAYVGAKGQIVVLPEFETVKVDEDGNVLGDKEDDGHAPRIYRKKKKKFTYQSTVRKHEKDRAAEIMAEEIREKERQIEFERRKQQEMEREFQRMRDMETQDRLQRLQTAQLQQQMSLLQQQQQMTSQFMQGPGMHPHQRYGVPNYTNGPSNVYTTAGGVGGVGGHIPPVNVSTYTMHSAPFVTPASTATTTVGGYDTNYLSSYMRMMGIQPPATQQQWAYLLSSVTTLGGATGMNPHSLGFDPTSKGQGLLVGSTGPDLSQLFAPKTSSAYGDASALVAQKASLMSPLNSGQMPQVLPVDGGLGSSGAVTFQTQTSTAVPLSQQPVSGVGPASVRPKSMMDISSRGDEAKDRTNPLYFSSDEEEERTTNRPHGKDINPLAHAATGAVNSTGGSMHNGVKSKSSKKKKRPASVAIPSLAASNIYRDVTSREEAGVTRVRVPDYRAATVYVVDTVVDDDDADSSDDEGSAGDGAVVNDLYDRVLQEAGDLENQNGGAVNMNNGVSPRDNGLSPRNHGFNPRGTFNSVGNGDSNTRSSGTKGLPANVYGPIGYKPVSFSPPNRRMESQPESVLDR